MTDAVTPIDLIRAAGLAIEAAAATAQDPGDWDSTLADAGPVLAWMGGWADPEDLAARQIAARLVLARRPAAGPGPAARSRFVTDAEAVRAAITAARGSAGHGGVTLTARTAAALRDLIFTAVAGDGDGPCGGRARLAARAAGYAGVSDRDGPDPAAARYDAALRVLFAGDPRGPLLDGPAGEGPDRDRVTPGWVRVTSGWVPVGPGTALDADGRYDIGGYAEPGNPRSGIARLAAGLSAGRAGRAVAEAARTGGPGTVPVFIRRAGNRQDIPDDDPLPRRIFGPDPGLTGGAQ